MHRLRSLVLPTLFAVPMAATAQSSVLVDQGTFSIQVAGVEVGTEDFSIRRQGLLANATFIAHGDISISRDGDASHLISILEARAPVGAATLYQLQVTGAEALEVRLWGAGPRYGSSFVSAAGQEEREFRARPDTRVVESFVAHHFYFLFLREARVGDIVPVICPRLRREHRYEVASVLEEELTLGKITVPARRVTFTVSGEQRTAWFDRQGRVLRVEVPSEEYVAVRVDLVG